MLVKGKKRLDKFEYMLLCLHVAVMDLPLEAIQLKHLLPMFEAVKEGHQEVVKNEVAKANGRTNTN